MGGTARHHAGLHVADREHHRLRIDFDPDDRSHLAAAYNSTAPGLVEIAAPDSNAIQVTAIIDQPLATLIALRYPGTADMSAAMVNAFANGPDNLEQLRDREIAAQADRAMEAADRLEAEFRGLVRVFDDSVRSELLAFMSGQLEAPPAMPDPATIELDRASLIGIPFLLELPDARVVRAPARAPGPPPSPSRLAGLVERARTLTARMTEPVALEFGAGGEPEILPLRDGTNWPLWAAIVAVEPRESDGKPTMAIVPAGRLIADKPDALLTCGITIGPDDAHREEQALTVAADGVHAPNRLMEREARSWPPRKDALELGPDDIRRELVGYWSMLVPSLLERIVTALGEVLE
jgi:hypothetical protein